MTKIIFKGLGPTGNIVHDGKLIEDGAIVKMEDKVANAYMKSRLAYEITDEVEVAKIQELIRKNKEERNKVLKAAGKKEAKEISKNGGSK